ncbi:MAG: response regulator transcription factor FixJ [Pseudorhodoplanes sp.]|nr:Transcriptional regulatory protein FixJ [Pseudorhodoplanes sp.]MBW7949255.1 response regulator transcription factor FixJ [Pseudorhodoplanes sp.]MCL4712030.1 response regulator transcription factor FixJ [Pseudorhodoplanes sp.]GIK80243.1 MAG: DNA-binding response regulator [Alphaproteobacteria bacterium]
MADSGLVHVIDDDEAMRDSLAFLLKASSLEVRTYESATAFLSGLKDRPRGCVVTDIRMPGMSGIDLLRSLAEVKYDIPVIVITGHGDIPLAVEAMKLGAFEFLEKPFEDRRILTAIRSALERSREVGERANEISAIAERLASLSQRERQVLDGLVAGHPNKTIAFDLGISPRTVEVYRANVMDKMQANSLSDLVRMVLVCKGTETGA